MKYTIILALVLFSFAAISQESKTELNVILEEISDYNTTLDPQDSLWRGYHVNGPFSKMDASYYNSKKVKYEGFISKLQNLKESDLSEQESISKQLMMYKLQNTIDDVRYKMYLIPMTAEGGFYSGVGRSLGRLPFKTAKDYMDYLQWLPQYAHWMDEQLNLMKEGIRLG